ncbi:MAG: MarR family transcriptional regulator [Tardiphaga sp.]|jgi:DNA-binding MarR family transcriptional regulator|nr:MarR family transcriptional regulator [Tardiphaga sp.]
MPLQGREKSRGPIDFAISGYIPVNMEDTPCLCTSLRQAAFAATEIYDRALEPSGLKITMFRVVRRIANAERPSISELAKIVELDRSSLGRNLRVLEKDGLIRFEDNDQDERSKIVALTPAGKAALAKALPLWAKAQKKMSAVFGAEKDAVTGLLTRVHQADAAGV